LKTIFNKNNEGCSRNQPKINTKRLNRRSFPVELADQVEEQQICHRENEENEDISSNGMDKYIGIVVAIKCKDRSSVHIGGASVTVNHSRVDTLIFIAHKRSE
jgi:hypothetical protein